MNLNMAKSVVISEHAKRRAAERLNISRRNDIKHHFRKALMYGLSPSSFKGTFYRYLMSKLKKNKSCTIKIYSDFVYIHRNKKLITMFPVPERYLPVSQFLPEKHSFEEIENPADIELLKLYHTSEFKFYSKQLKSGSNAYLVALIINDELVSVSQGKSLEKQKSACVKQHFKELKDKNN